jgi:hypothetical protein
MQPLLVVANAHWCVEEVAEAWGGEQFGTRTVPDDPASAHKDDAVYLRENVAEVMGDQNQTCAFSCEATECVAEFALGSQVEGIRWFIEEQLARPVDKGAGNEDAAFFAG